MMDEYQQHQKMLDGLTVAVNEVASRSLGNHEGASLVAVDVATLGTNEAPYVSAHDSEQAYTAPLLADDATSQPRRPWGRWLLSGIALMVVVGMVVVAVATLAFPGGGLGQRMRMADTGHDVATTVDGDLDVITTITVDVYEDLELPPSCFEDPTNPLCVEE